MISGGRFPLIEALEKQRKARFRFHVPAHQANAPGANRYSYDLTELPGLDDLYNPGGAIKESQRLAADFFGAEETFFLVNGSSAGLVASLWASSRPGETVVLSRNIHRSVVAGLILSGARPRFIPVKDHFRGVPLNIRENSAVSLLQGIESPAALVVTNPSYWGISSDLRNLRDLMEGKKTVFIVDEAHGGHFLFSKAFPPGAASAGADLWVNSAHKTLGALTPGSLLHRRGKRVDVNRLKFALGLIQTSSPPYPVLASLDLLRARSGSEWSRGLETAGFVRDQIRQIKGFTCLDRSQLPSGFFLDPLRLTIFVEDISLNGFQIGSILRRTYGIEIEMAGPNYLLLLVHAGHDRRGAKALIHALRRISADYYPASSETAMAGGYPVPPLRITPRDAAEASWREVSLKDACGSVSAVTVAPFPPGTPVLIPGEVIIPELLEKIREDLRKGQYFQGLGSGPNYSVAVVAE